MKYYLIKLTTKNYDDIKSMSSILIDYKLGAYLSLDTDKKIVIKPDINQAMSIVSRYELSFYTREDLIPLFIGILKKREIRTEEFVEIPVERFSSLFTKKINESLQEPRNDENIPKDAKTLEEINKKYYKPNNSKDFKKEG